MIGWHEQQLELTRNFESKRAYKNNAVAKEA